MLYLYNTYVCTHNESRDRKKRGKGEKKNRYRTSKEEITSICTKGK